MSAPIVKIYTSGIYVPQNARCPLWRACVVDGQSFREICRQHDNDWLALRRGGFNRNFLTRWRWLDLDVLVDVLHLTLGDLMRDLGVTSAQVTEWHLSATEIRRLNMSHDRFILPQPDLSWLVDPASFQAPAMATTR